MLTYNEAEGIPFNPPSPADKIQLPAEASLVLIEVDTDTFEIETYQRGCLWSLFFVFVNYITAISF